MFGKVASSLIFVGLVGLSIANITPAQAQDGTTIYAPIVQGPVDSFGTLPSVDLSPTPSVPTPTATAQPTPAVQPTPASEFAVIAGLDGLPNYQSLDLEVVAQQRTENAALNVVNDPPNATTTVSNVQSIGYDTGTLQGSKLTKVYTYDKTTTTYDYDCVVFKAYRSNGDKFLTEVVTACYTAYDGTAPEAKFASAYAVFESLFNAYNR